MTTYSEYSNVVNGTTWTAGEAIIRAGNTVAWYDSQLLSTITKDGANLVSRWNDRLGSGRDLIQATGTNQPLWSATGITFDGIDNIMQTAAFVWNQPAFVYAVLKQITWTNGDGIWDGIGLYGLLIQQNSVSPQIRLYVGSVPNPTFNNSNLPINTFGIIRALSNGAGSKLQINETIAKTGNPGANNPGGFTLGAVGNSTGYSHIQVAEVILRKTADTGGDEAAIYSYLSTKYSI